MSSTPGLGSPVRASSPWPTRELPPLSARFEDDALCTLDFGFGRGDRREAGSGLHITIGWPRRQLLAEPNPLHARPSSAAATSGMSRLTTYRLESCKRTTGKTSSK